jgi:hypothetical protein
MTIPNRMDETSGGSAPALSPDAKWSLRAAIVWGVVVGLIQGASPFGFWWLDPATVYALGLVAIAFVYIGFAVAHGRWKVIGIEATVAMAFVIVAAIGITGSAWLLVIGFADDAELLLVPCRAGVDRDGRGQVAHCVERHLVHALMASMSGRLDDLVAATQDSVKSHEARDFGLLVDEFD